MNLWVDFDLKFDPILQGKNGQNKPENPQNWNMAKITPKSETFMKLDFRTTVLISGGQRKLWQLNIIDLY